MTNKRVAAKTVNGNVINGFAGQFSFDKFDPDTIHVEFDGGVKWMFDREMLLAGGDLGGDVKITVNQYDTTIYLIREDSNAIIVFDTLHIREFCNTAVAPISIPIMRECMVDNFIVQFHNWNQGLIA